MIWESPPESILIIRKLDYDTTGPFIEVFFYSRDSFFSVIFFAFLADQTAQNPFCSIVVDVN